MNMQSEYLKYINKFTDDLKQEIDFEFLSDILSAQGWTPVEFLPFTYSKQAKDIADWAEQHCMGKWRHCGVKFVFERAADATAAMLKWQ
jgi:hypothetical protein